MIVYAESNFLLEMAYARLHAGDASRLLGLAAAGRIQLYLPAFSHVEAVTRVRSDAAARNELANRVEKELVDLSRFPGSRPSVSGLSRLREHLLEIQISQRRDLESTLGEALSHGGTIAFTREVLERGASMAGEFGMELPDSIIAASVLLHASSLDPATPKCFVTTDRRGFGDLRLREALADQNCRVFMSFPDVLGFLTRSGGEPRESS